MGRARWSAREKGPGSVGLRARFAGFWRVPHPTRAALSVVKQCLNVAAPAHDVKNEHVLAMDTVDDDILSDRKASQGGTQIIVARTTDMRIGGKHKKNGL